MTNESISELIARAWQIRSDPRLDACREARWLITDLISAIEKLRQR